MKRPPSELVEHVAERLEPLGDRLVFLGGAVTGFLEPRDTQAPGFARVFDDLQGDFPVGSPGGGVGKVVLQPADIAELAEGVRVPLKYGG